MWESALRCRLLIDWEGTLVDSGPGMLLALRRACIRAGCPRPVEENLNWVLDTPLDDALTRLAGPDRPAMAAAIKHYLPRYFRRWGRFQGRLQSGIRAMLDRLHQSHNVESVLFTGENAQATQLVLQHYALEQSFDRVLCSRRGACLQCKAMTAEQMARQSDPADRLLVWLTDDPQELRLAQHFGIPAIAAGWGRATRGELATVAPPMLAPHPGNVLHLLSQLGQRPIPGTLRGGADTVRYPVAD